MEEKTKTAAAAADNSRRGDPETIQKINVNGTIRDIEDVYARENMLNAYTGEQDVDTMAKFNNGITVKGKPPIIAMEATVKTLDAGKKAEVDVNVDTEGTAFLDFGIPKGDTGATAAMFVDDALTFTGMYETAYVESTLMIGSDGAT